MSGGVTAAGGYDRRHERRSWRELTCPVTILCMEPPEGNPPADGRDELSRSMDRWQRGMALALVTGYGHSWAAASGIAALQRDTIEQGLREPMPLVIVTGI